MIGSAIVMLLARALHGDPDLSLAVCTCRTPPHYRRVGPGNRGYPRAEVVELPGVNHMFHEAETGAPSEYGRMAAVCKTGPHRQLAVCNDDLGKLTISFGPISGAAARKGQPICLAAPAILSDRPSQ